MLQKNINIADIDRNITIIDRISSFIDFKNTFDNLNVSNIEKEFESEESDSNKSENFNIDV